MVAVGLEPTKPFGATHLQCVAVAAVPYDQNYKVVRSVGLGCVYWNRTNVSRFMGGRPYPLDEYQHITLHLGHNNVNYSLFTFWPKMFGQIAMSARL